MQTPIEGTSLLYTFNNAKAPERHRTQYFEMFGNRAIYHDGWLARTIHRAPWQTSNLPPLTTDVWDLYDVRNDFSLTNNLAATQPGKLKEMQALFMREAEKYHVLPLLGGLTTFFGFTPPLPSQSRFTFYSDVQNVASGMIPPIYNHSYTISAELEIPHGGAEGAAPQPHFCYVNEGLQTTDRFVTYLNQYGRLFAALGDFHVIYAAEHPSLFAGNPPC